MSKKNKIKARGKANHPVQKIEKIKPEKSTSFWTWLIPVLILTGISFLPMLTNGFTNWDDDKYITGNPLIKGPDWNAMFTKASASNYHPVTMLSLAFNYAISGTDPFSYHLVD